MHEQNGYSIVRVTVSAIVYSILVVCYGLLFVVGPGM